MGDAREVDRPARHPDHPSVGDAGEVLGGGATNHAGGPEHDNLHRGDVSIARPYEAGW